jgi:hypothetical protein
MLLAYDGEDLAWWDQLLCSLKRMLEHGTLADEIYELFWQLLAFELLNIVL